VRLERVQAQRIGLGHHRSLHWQSNNAMNP
jgi:hypothetical protein